MTKIHARSAKITLTVADDGFPLDSIPPKGAPGSATARVPLEIIVPGSGAFKADLSARGLQWQREVRDQAPGGFWVVSGRLLAGGELAEAGCIYAPPKEKPEEQP